MKIKLDERGERTPKERRKTMREKRLCEKSRVKGRFCPMRAEERVTKRAKGDNERIETV